MYDLKLYTQNKCGWCVRLEQNLTDWGLEYEIHNITLDKDAKQFMKDKGHKTVPQLYYGGEDVMRGASENLTKDTLQNNMERVEWPNIDSGVEGRI